MPYRASIHQTWKLVPIAAALAGLVGTAQAQTPAARNSTGAGGKTLTPAVHAPFNPGMTDGQGHVLPALPAQRVGEDDGPVMTEKGKADKALAEQHKGPILHKPAPRTITPGGTGTTGAAARNKWKMAEGQPQGSFQNFFEGVADTQSEPPDVAMAVGPNEIVAAANSVVNTFDKTGDRLGSQPFASFFAPLGLSNWFLFDPVVIYDPYISRFWLTVTARNDTTNGSLILIGLSSSQDSTAGWELFSVDFTVDGSNHTSNWCDYPHTGYDSQALYISCNQVSFPASSGSFQYAKIRLMNKSQFLNNTCCSWYDQWNLKEGFLNLSTSATVQPAQMRNASDSDGEFLIDAQGGGGSNSTLQVWHFPDPINNPGQLDSASINVTNYAPAPGGQQPNGVTSIDTGDTRLLFANWQAGHLSTGQNTSCNNRSCAAFYELDVSGFSNLAIVNDWALQNSSEDFYYPSVDQNNNSDKIMVYSRSSTTEDAGADTIAIPRSTTCTACSSPEVSLAAGASTYSRVAEGRNRWGDYSSAAADPDGLGIWISGEFASAMNVWATEIGASYNSYLPVVQSIPTTVNFGNQAVGSSAQQLVFFFNNGNADLEITGRGITGPDFSQTSNCIGPIEPTFNCLTTVVFSPTTAATRSGTIFLIDNVTSSQNTVTLTGTGVIPTVSVTPASLKFVNTPAHLTSAAQTVTVKNTGIVPLTINSITATGGFTETNNCVGTVGVGGSCSVTVKFAPSKAGAQTGTLTINDNASPATQTVALSGTGTDFGISVSPATVTVTKGHSVTTTITVTPIDSFAGTVNLTCSSSDTAVVTCAVKPTSLSVKGAPLTALLGITASNFLSGTFQVTVKGADGALNHTAIVKVTVQ